MEPDGGSHSRAWRFYVLIPLILVLLPMLLEFGCLLNASMCLNQQASHLAEMAAIGAAPEVIEAELDRCRGGVDGRFAECSMLHRHGDAGGAVWKILGRAAGENDATPGDSIRVRLHYDHALVLGGLLAPFFGAQSDNTVDLDALVEVMRR